MESDQSDTSVRDLGDESLDNEPDDDDLSNRQNDSLPTSGLILPLEDAVDDGHIDRYDMLDDVDEVFSLSEKMVHYVGGHIMRQHWTAYKAVLVFQAGANVCKLATMTKEEKNRKQIIGLKHPRPLLNVEASTLSRPMPFFQGGEDV
jgi:hypothetical protein